MACDIALTVGADVPEFLALGALLDSWNVGLWCLWLLVPKHSRWHLLPTVDRMLLRLTTFSAMVMFWVFLSLLSWVIVSLLDR